VQPSADLASPAYPLAASRLGVAEPDSYEAQATDWMSLVALAIAKAGAATGTAIRDHVREISQGGGEKMYDAVEGLKLIAANRKIDYDGASGPCDFSEIGDILDCKFRYHQVENGKFRFLKIA
jgi:branched-chain amino acid transport system substrate-binding protein